MKSVKTWIVLADGAQARVFENTGPNTGLDHIARLDLDQTALQAQDIMSDKPGRSFASAGQGRSAMEYSTDPVDKRQDDFTRRIADTLLQELERDNFDRLVIAAAPAALGTLRKHLDPRVSEKIIAELPKDLANTPVPQLPKHFEHVLRL